MAVEQPLNAQTTPEQALGAALRRYRKEAGWSLDQLAEKVRFSSALVGFVERAQRRATKEFVEACEKALGLNGELVELWRQLEPRSAPPWFRAWTKVESQARILRTWQPLIVPGLLQTPDYARALLRCEPGVSLEAVETALETRLQRQTIFNRPSPPILSAVIDEAVLLRPIGGRAVMAGQLEHLLEMTSRPRIDVQVVALDIGANPGLLGGFVIAQLTDGPDHAYLESPGNDQVTDRPEETQAISLRYDAIRAWAHPVHVSGALIRETMVKYGAE